MEKMYNCCEQYDSPYDACVTGLKVKVCKGVIILIAIHFNNFIEIPKLAIDVLDLKCNIIYKSSFSLHGDI